MGIRVWLREWYAGRRFEVAAHNGWLYQTYTRNFFTPKPGSCMEVLDKFSRKLNRPVEFVQVGANDGITHDPIHIFIKRDGWKGVMLEPQVYMCQRYLNPLYARSTGVQVINAAVGNHEGTATLYTIGFSEKRWATGIASFNRDVIERAFDNGHVARRAAKAGESVPTTGELIRATKVPIITPQQALSQAKLQHFDVLQIDTEGYDFEVLKCFDLATTKPTIINFESSHLSPEDTKACHALLRNNGYVFKVIGGDTIAVQQEVAEELF